jgi:hypothetical protein
MNYIIPFDKRQVRITLELVSPLDPTVGENMEDFPLVNNETAEQIRHTWEAFGMSERLLEIIGKLLKDYAR